MAIKALTETAEAVLAASRKRHGATGAPAGAPTTTLTASQEPAPAGGGQALLAPSWPPFPE